MKTSVKIFLGSMVLLGTGLVIYDLQLNAAFHRGDYTRPFYDYEVLNYRGFDRIKLNSSTALNIKLVKGDFKVMANPVAHDFLDIHQEGSTLILNARFKDHYRSLFADYTLYISCPVLKDLRADARYKLGDILHTDDVVWMDWSKATSISGFNLDSLTIGEDNASNLVLKEDTIGKLSALVGAGGALTIGANNVIGGGDVEVMNRARLFINSPNIGNITYHLADSAALNITGAAAKQILKTGQP
jgi:hypothetical protein